MDQPKNCSSGCCPPQDKPECKTGCCTPSQEPPTSEKSGCSTGCCAPSKEAPKSGCCPSELAQKSETSCATGCCPGNKQEAVPAGSKRALFAEDTSTDPEVLAGVALVREVHNFPITCESSGTWITFPSVQAAKDWVSHHVVAFAPDNGACIGREEDSLIKDYQLFRVNEGFYHLVLYIVEKKLVYNPTTKTWTNNIRTNAKDWADKELKKYNLA